MGRSFSFKDYKITLSIFPNTLINYYLQSKLRIIGEEIFNPKFSFLINLIILIFN